MSGLCGQIVPLYRCPSDGLGRHQDGAGVTYQRTRGNYVVNWGVANYDQAAPGPGNAPFSHINGSRSTPRITKMIQITDGSSNTLMMSEYLMPQSGNDDDWRADIHNDDGVFRFHTSTTPNTTTADCVSWNAVTAGDAQMPVQPAGCTPQFNAARSRHPGGVMVAFCDGSVRFITKNVSLSTWQALGSMDANDAPASDY